MNFNINSSGNIKLSEAIKGATFIDSVFYSKW